MSAPESSAHSSPPAPGRPSASGSSATPRSVVLAVAVGGIALGGLVGLLAGRWTAPATDSTPPPTGEEVTTWTCSMHPQVKLPSEGKCPICFMDLIPGVAGPAPAGDPRELTMTPEGVALADIRTLPARRSFAAHMVRLVGKVDYDETRLAYITSWVPGRLDRLFIDYTGVSVREGDHLVEIYSPDLVVSQNELLFAFENARRRPADAEAARTLKLTEEKLRLLGLTEKQIKEIEERGEPTDHVTIHAPIGGVVIHKEAREGMYVKTGERIYTIADLSHVWVFMDAYESDVPWIRYGQEVEFTTETYPGESFTGRIAFIDPMLSEMTRTVKVRVNLDNADRRLKPGMFVRALIKSRVARGGQVIDDDLAGKWISPHHPEIVRDEPGNCPICGVELMPAEELGFVGVGAGAEPPLVIPASAPLRTGRRAVVYVKVAGAEQPTFQGREVLLGPRVAAPEDAPADDYHGDWYIVRHGLDEGEEVVIQGNFKIDSALQIAARPSMMSPDGGAAAAGHDHGGKRAADGATAQAGHAKPLDVPAAFRVGLSPLFTAYLAAAEALATDDLAAARAAVAGLPEDVAAVDPSSLSTEGRGRWKTLGDAVVLAALETADATDRPRFRRQFERLSESVLSVAQTFGHALPQSLHQMHCPMALEGRGATWLQTAAAVRNPYFGPAMRECGERQASFHSQLPLVVSLEFRRRLEPLYDAYVALQTALAADDREASVAAAAGLQRVLTEIDADPLGPREAQAWQVARHALGEMLQQFADDAPLEVLRRRFEPLSGTFLSVARRFGHARAAPLYEAFCPMAFDNQGAAWLQAERKIANPYFGSQMLRCGSIRRTYLPGVAEAAEPPPDAPPSPPRPEAEPAGEVTP